MTHVVLESHGRQAIDHNCYYRAFASIIEVAYSVHCIQLGSHQVHEVVHAHLWRKKLEYADRCTHQ